MPGPNLQGALDLSGLVKRAQAQPPTGAEGGGVTARTPAGGVLNATEQSFGEVVELSQTVPVIVEFVDPKMEPTGVDSVIASYGGRIALARVDPFTNPQLAQAFRIEQVPYFAAVIAGRPLPLFAGLVAETQLREVIDQVLQAAAQQGVTGTLEASDAAGAAEPVEPPLPPHHQDALDAIDAGNYQAAITAYETAIAQNPRDDLAVAGLAQVRFLERLGSAEVDDIDRDFAEGRVEEAFATLLDGFIPADADGRARIQARLLEFFTLLGPEDPRVGPARRRLTGLLF